MMKQEAIADFALCPECGSAETISELACGPFKATGKIEEEAFTSLRQAIVPLEAPALAGLAVTCVITHFDVCANCGTERCTRAALARAPIQMAPPNGGNRHHR